MLSAMVVATGGFVAAGAAAQTPPPGPPGPGLITTHAQAHRRLPNTVADASVSIEVHGRDLRATATALSQQSQTLLRFLRGQPTERLRTDGTSLDPEVQELRGQPDRIKGYTGRITVSFRTAPDQLPLLLAGCLDNGATGLGQFGATPREEDVEAARRDMVAEAGKAALAQAQAIADTVGQHIAGVDLVEVDPVPATESIAVAGVMAERAAMARPVPPPAMEAGDSGLSVTVVMVVRLAPPT